MIVFGISCGPPLPGNLDYHTMNMLQIYELLELNDPNKLLDTHVIMSPRTSQILIMHELLKLLCSCKHTFQAFFLHTGIFEYEFFVKFTAAIIFKISLYRSI